MASGQSTGQDAFVSIEDSGGTARTLSTDITTTTLNFSAETPDASTYGVGTRKRVAGGIKDWSLEIGGFFNDTATTGIETVFWGILGAQTVIAWGPAGSTSTYTRYSGSCILQEYNIEAPVDNVVGFSATVVASAGSLTRGTF